MAEKVVVVRPDDDGGREAEQNESTKPSSDATQSPESLNNVAPTSATARWTAIIRKNALPVNMLSPTSSSSNRGKASERSTSSGKKASRKSNSNAAPKITPSKPQLPRPPFSGSSFDKLPTMSLPEPPPVHSRRLFEGLYMDASESDRDGFTTDSDIPEDRSALVRMRGHRFWVPRVVGLIRVDYANDGFDLPPVYLDLLDDDARAAEERVAASEKRVREAKDKQAKEEEEEPIPRALQGCPRVRTGDRESGLVCCIGTRDDTVLVME